LGGRDGRRWCASGYKSGDPTVGDLGVGDAVCVPVALVRGTKEFASNRSDEVFGVQ